ncbi:hypothetical protein Q7C30_011410 [Pseudomonas sp. RAC1]|uniref:hypothetical protein n=1 Tax=Pseudomonas sp. RAC1 TaxID=3064900 RepID=UPI00271649EF|nr:hypothetical protein [Pseudomonas sp. RAC1]MDV9032702.1 hypothetical protein [Pseudomonas sp. RAC1]
MIDDVGQICQEGVQANFKFLTGWQAEPLMALVQLQRADMGDTGMTSIRSLVYRRFAKGRERGTQSQPRVDHETQNGRQCNVQ